MALWTKNFCLMAGLLLMVIERFRPWELSNPDAVFAFAVGLMVCPIALHILTGD